jgi:hypothetical protein
MSKKTYEFATKQGFLTNIKVTTVETVETTIPGEGQWFNSDFIELLLMIDDHWRTPRKLMKYSQALRLMDSSKIAQMLKGLEKSGLVESKKEGKNHTQWRRVHKFPQHDGLMG